MQIFHVRTAKIHSCILRMIFSHRYNYNYDKALCIKMVELQPELCMTVYAMYLTFTAIASSSLAPSILNMSTSLVMPTSTGKVVISL